MLHDLFWLMIAAAALCCIPLALRWDASFPPEEPKRTQVPAAEPETEHSAAA